MRGLASLRGGLMLKSAEKLAAVEKICPPLARTYGFGSHCSDNNPDVIWREKERNLRGDDLQYSTIIPGWSELLASDSEAAVKAERFVNDATTTASLQAFTIQLITQMYPTGPGGQGPVKVTTLKKKAVFQRILRS